MPRHRLLFLDYESYYADDYTLRKLPIPNYVLDERFETQMVAVAEDDRPPTVVDGPDFPAYLAEFDPAVTTTVTFNALFDNFILGVEYGFVPATMIDAMGMARALLGHVLRRFSLGAVAEHLGLGTKLHGGQALANVKGKRRAQIMQEGLWPQFCSYALQDVELCRGIFLALIKDFPRSERRLMDMVLRCAVEPQFLVDKDLLRDHIADLEYMKAHLLNDAGVGGESAELMSSKKFQAALENLGVCIQYKTTPTGREAPAFAKTDSFMAELQEHPDQRVQALVSARLGLKSTLEETRSKKLLSIAELNWHCYRDGSPRLYSGGTMPIPLRYGAAHTHRLGGDWGMNMQNMPSVIRSGGKSKLRKSLIAPPGYTIIVADLGQIEARLVAWVCGCKKLVEQFALKQDPYAKLGSSIFGFEVNRKVHLIEGFIGKTGILGLGYGCGKEHFFDMVEKLARAMGLDISKIWDAALATKSVNTYRNVYHEIPAGWRRLDFIIENAWLGKSGPMPFGPNNVVTISQGRVDLPSQMPMQYDNPHADAKTGEKWFEYGGAPHKLYGAKFLENIVQALARIVVMNAALRIADHGRCTFGVEYGPGVLRFRLQAHDELVFIVRDEIVDSAKTIIHTEMTRSPSWAPDLPLTADVGTGKSYGEAK